MGETAALTGPLVGGTAGKATGFAPLIKENEKVAKPFGWLAVNVMFTGVGPDAPYLRTPQIGSAKIVPPTLGGPSVAVQALLSTRMVSGVLVSITVPAPFTKSSWIVWRPFDRFVESSKSPSVGLSHRKMSLSARTG